MEPLSKRSFQILKKLYEKASFTTTYTLSAKQGELSTQLGISKQYYNLQLRRLKDSGYIRIGRDFIDVTEKGLIALGISTEPYFILVKVSSNQKLQVYQKMKKLFPEALWKNQVDPIIIREGEDLANLLKQHPFSVLHGSPIVPERSRTKDKEKRKEESNSEKR
jgi:DNA-binding Lrp family transcriptional regulator